MRKLIMIFSLAILISCQKKIYFNDFESAFLDVYEDGDTLIFESIEGLRDTAYISKKDIRYANWNPLSHSGKYRLLIGEIKEESRTGPKGVFINNGFVSLIKNHPDSISLFISFQEIIMTMRFENFGLESLKSYKVGNQLYRFRIQRTTGKVYTEESLYWHLEKGLIKFITKDGTVWELVKRASKIDNLKDHL